MVEDDEGHAEVIRDVLASEGHDVCVAHRADEGLATLQAGGVDLVVTDLHLQDASGLDLVAHSAELREGRATPQVIVVTGYGTVEGAVAAMRLGALHYLQKPLDVGILRETVRSAGDRIHLERQHRDLKKVVDKSFAFPGILGGTQAMQRVFDVMNQIADTDATVLVRGESGTGKELVARALHLAGPRRNKPFVALNCAALAEGVLESELFGHEEGAFTGATSRRIGRFEAADGGTLFLDEIGDMPLGTQAHLLRALEQGEVTRVGANEPVHVDVRVIAATHRDLGSMVADGSFREDLNFRLRVVELELPPLRERLADLPHLAEHFLGQAAERHGKPARSFAPATLEILMSYHWPGNVRELKNAVEAMVLMSRGKVITSEAIPPYVRPGEIELELLRSLSGLPLELVERTLITNTLRDVGGSRGRAAKLLKISSRTLYRKIAEYGLSRRRQAEDPAEAATSE